MYQLIQKEYKVGMYIRLSREDGDKQESESISNQRKIITRYLEENHLTLVDEYIDDGVSGTTFDRTGFNRLLQDIENEKINMVVTKDLSRLGRDYIKTGYYIENYFPEKQIRYVSILDGVDTYTDASSNDITPFKAILNDMYAKDISKKIRSVFKEKQKQGEYMCSTPAYGYKKDILNKNHLIIDDRVVDVVRTIYDMYANGKGSKLIVEYLNKNHYLSPRGYRTTGCIADEETQYEWNATTVCAILTNEVYIGNTVQNKKTVISYKVKKLRNVDKSQQIRVENTHEAIIDKDVFSKVQAIKEKNSKMVSKQYDYLLKGVLYCKHCGRQLQVVLKKHNKSKNPKIPYIVDTDSKKRGCYARNLNYPKFEAKMLETIRKICQIYTDKEKLEETYQRYSNKATDMLSSLKKQLNTVNQQITQSTAKIEQLYEDRLNKLLPEDVFIRVSQRHIEEREQLKMKANSLQERIGQVQQQKLLNSENDNERLNDSVKQFLEMKNIDKPTLFRLVDKIEIDKDKNIFLSFNFSQLNIINENIDDFIQLEELLENQKNVV